MRFGAPLTTVSISGNVPVSDGGLAGKLATTTMPTDTPVSGLKAVAFESSATSGSLVILSAFVNNPYIWGIWLTCRVGGTAGAAYICHIQDSESTPLVLAAITGRAPASPSIYVPLGGLQVPTINMPIVATFVITTGAVPFVSGGILYSQPSNPLYPHSA